MFGHTQSGNGTVSVVIHRMSEEIQKIVLAGGNALQIAAEAKRIGINDLRASALLKARQGVTSLAEINRVTKD